MAYLRMSVQSIINMVALFALLHFWADSILACRLKNGVYGYSQHTATGNRYEIILHYDTQIDKLCKSKT